MKKATKQINWAPIFANTSSEEMLILFAYEGESLSELKGHYDAGVKKVARALSAMPVSKARQAAKAAYKRNGGIY